MRTNQIAWIALAIASNGAGAHVSIETPFTTASAGTKIVLRVGHGCEGSATTALQVRIPAGFRGAKPMPKAGWGLTTKTEPLAAPYTSHGKLISEDVTLITWAAQSASAFLLDNHYDEFVLQGQAPDRVGPVWFKVLQTCEKGNKDWSETPATGSDHAGLKQPAALLEVRAKKAEAHQH
jgi:periplasmic copper chaperone A